MSKTFSTGDVSSHSKPDDLWIIVDDDVYDLTKFQDDHPGENSSIYLLTYGVCPALLHRLAHL